MMQVIGDQKTLKCSVFDWPGLPIWGWKFLKDTEEVSVSSAQEHGIPAMVRSTSHNISNWSQFWKKLAVLNSLCGRLIRVPKSSIPSAWLEPRDAHLYEAFLCIPKQALYCKDHQPNEEGQNPTCRTWWLHQPPLKKYAKVKMGEDLPQVAGWKSRKYLKSPTSKRMGCKTWS